MADVGFLEQLGIPSTDERAILEEQRRQAYTQGGPGVEFTAGQQARPLLMGAFSALGGLLSGNTPNAEHSGRSFRGLGANFSQGVNRETDRQVAAAAGIRPEVLESRRNIRQELAKQEYSDTESFDNQIKMAKKVAQIALRNGDSETYGKAIAALGRVREQQQQFNKLQAVTEATQTEAQMAGLTDAFLDGKAVTGSFAWGEDEDGNRVPGLVIADKAGDTYFKAFGEELVRDDPALRKPGETLDQRIRRSTAKQFVADLKGQIADSASAIRKFDRVLGQVVKLREEGMAQSALGASGNLLTFIDNTVENLKGFAKPWFGVGGSVDNASKYRVSQDSQGNVRASGIRAWMNEQIGDPDSDVWAAIQLPEGVQEASREAQLYRANLMELAYMAARLAEPSNRGLSDNDIRNALLRLGDSPRPEVIMTRFAEILGDGAFDIENKMGTLYGNFGDEYSNEDVQKAVGGDTYFTYKQQLDDIQNKYDFQWGQAGEVIFDDGTSVGGGPDSAQPGPDYGPNTPIIPNYNDSMSNEEAEAALGL